MAQQISDMFPTREQAQLWVEQRIVRFDTVAVGSSIGMGAGKMLDTRDADFVMKSGDQPLSRFVRVERVDSRAFKIVAK